jgi:serine/threonine protein kinase
MKKSNYHIVSEIGHGSFGNIYKCKNKDTNKEYALKVESRHSKNFQGQLKQEQIVYKDFSDVFIEKGVPWPKMYEYGYNVNGSDVLVMDLLGENLDLKNNTFSIPFLAKSMINLLEKFHSKYYIHRDLKPQNFVKGIGDDKNIIYLIDYGITKQKSTKIEYQKSLKGTVRFASINTHLGCEQSYRDDMCSLFYVLLFFVLKELPWQKTARGITDKKELYKNVMHDKMSLHIEDMIKKVPEKLKEPFLFFYIHVNNLGFDEFPNYKYLTSLF